MNKFLTRQFVLITALMAFNVIAARGDEDHDHAAPAPAASTPAATTAVLATKTPFITGLKEPQGLALDKNSNILLCDYGAGEVLRYSRDGKLMEKLATGLNGPTQIVVRFVRSHQNRVAEIISVSERKANRVVRVRQGNIVTPIGGEVVQPLGLALDPQGDLFVVAHTTSKIYRLAYRIPQGSDTPIAEWRMIYATYKDDGARRYGYRCLANDGGALLMSDEVGKQVLLLTSNGRIATWATGITDPSGIVIGPDGAVYVCNEGDGGQLLKLSPEGKATVVADGLGRPRSVLFLNAKTALVSDRNGNVWRLNWP